MACYARYVPLRLLRLPKLSLLPSNVPLMPLVRRCSTGKCHCESSLVYDSVSVSVSVCLCLSGMSSHNRTVLSAAAALGLGLAVYVLYTHISQRRRRKTQTADRQTHTHTDTHSDTDTDTHKDKDTAHTPVSGPRIVAPRLHLIVVDSDASRKSDSRTSTATPGQLAALSVCRSLSSSADSQRIIVQNLGHHRLSTDNWQTFTAAAVVPDTSAPSRTALARLAAYATTTGPVVVVGTHGRRLVDVMKQCQPTVTVTDCTQTLLDGDDADSTVSGGILLCSAPSVPSSDEPAYNWRCVLQRLGVPVAVTDPTQPSAGYLVASTDVCDAVWAAVGHTGKPSSTARGGVCLDAATSSITVFPSDTPVSHPVDPADPSALSIGLVPVSNTASLPSHIDAGEFGWKDFFRVLRTRCLGRSVLHWDAIGSTQTLLDRNPAFLACVPNTAGLVVVANRQLAGRGRGGNAWISPTGSISTTVHQRLHAVPSCLVFYQYGAGLAMVEAVCDMRGYDAIPLRLKWPNDIYYAPDGSDPTTWVKLGGVLVTCSSMGSTTDVMIGCGLNVTNPAPTVSLSQVLEHHNASHGTALTAPSAEVLLARFLNRLEAVLHDLSTRGFPAIEDRYYTRWLHSNAKVSVEGHSGPVVVRGVHHKTGELVADVMSASPTSSSSGSGGHPATVLLSPGDSSFDILNGLLSRRSRG